MGSFQWIGHESESGWEPRLLLILASCLFSRVITCSTGWYKKDIDDRGQGPPWSGSYLFRVSDDLSKSESYWNAWNNHPAHSTRFTEVIFTETVITSLTCMKSISKCKPRRSPAHHTQMPNTWLLIIIAGYPHQICEWLTLRWWESHRQTPKTKNTGSEVEHTIWKQPPRLLLCPQRKSNMKEPSECQLYSQSRLCDPWRCGNTFPTRHSRVYRSCQRTQWQFCHCKFQKSEF